MISLATFTVGLEEVARQLTRIADALERLAEAAAPPPAIPETPPRRARVSNVRDQPRKRPPAAGEGRDA